MYRGFISGNQLKIAACVLMLVDHIGMILLPEVIALRIVGRLSMPLFAFTFAEGCFYTRKKFKHFALIVLLGIVTSIAMSAAYGRVYGNILITFSLSCLIIYGIAALKRGAFAKNGRLAALGGALFACALGLSVWLCCFSGADIEYGIAGVLLPVTVRLLDFRSYGAKGVLAEIYSPAIVFICFFIGLVAVSASSGAIQFFCIFAMIPLLFYSGKRGKLKLKYAFYIFYPLHLAVLGGLYLLIY